MKTIQFETRCLIFSLLSEVTVIILISLATGLLVNQFRSKRLPLIADWSTEARLTEDTGERLFISIEEAGALYSNKRAIFLDARSPEDYSRGHILGAHNVPWQNFDEYIEFVWTKIPEDRFIVTYCDGDPCSMSEELAKTLISMGYKKVKILLDGWNHWMEAGYPVDKGY